MDYIFTLIAKGVGVGSQLPFYQNGMDGNTPTGWNYQRFCKCEYGDLVTGAINCFASSQPIALYVSETLEIGSD